MTKGMMGFFIKFLAATLLLLFLLYLFITCRDLGYRIFADRAKDAPGHGVEAMIRVSRNESLKEIAKDLEEKEIVDDAFVFRVQIRCMDDYDKIRPGKYKMSSEMTPSRILQTMTAEETEGP
ncbi:MAG: endolytic transglycosylase MltG [Eubacterium sp.]|nr:endolytic transglycosylase MltG [Eubacterium sp.]